VEDSAPAIYQGIVPLVPFRRSSSSQERPSLLDELTIKQPSRKKSQSILDEKKNDTRVSVAKDVRVLASAASAKSQDDPPPISEHAKQLWERVGDSGGVDDATFQRYLQEAEDAMPLRPQENVSPVSDDDDDDVDEDAPLVARGPNPFLNLVKPAWYKDWDYPDEEEEEEEEEDLSVYPMAPEKVSQRIEGKIYLRHGMKRMWRAPTWNCIHGLRVHVCKACKTAPRERKPIVETHPHLLAE
jgi:hypothetical protein